MSYLESNYELPTRNNSEDPIIKSLKDQRNPDWTDVYGEKYKNLAYRG